RRAGGFTTPPHPRRQGPAPGGALLPPRGRAFPPSPGATGRAGPRRSPPPPVHCVLMAPLPAMVLMQPTLIAKPFHREGWVYEEKVDGWRMVAYKQGFSIRWISGQGGDHAGRFPGIVAALKTLPDNPLVLDGEVAIYDRQLISRFEWLRHHAAPEVATPPLFMVFDCLSARGKDLRKQPLY